MFQKLEGYERLDTFCSSFVYRSTVANSVWVEPLIRIMARSSLPSRILCCGLAELFPEPCLHCENNMLNVTTEFCGIHLHMECECHK
jgi:hypothetical protein